MVGEPGESREEIHPLAFTRIVQSHEAEGMRRLPNEDAGNITDSECPAEQASSALSCRGIPQANCGIF